MAEGDDPRETVAALCRHFYAQGWMPGSGGAITVRSGDKIYMAPSGVQKERIKPEDMFVLNMEGEIIERPLGDILKLTSCNPNFFNVYNLRKAGAVIHSHSHNAVMATLFWKDEFRVTGLQMIKALRGKIWTDLVKVPIIENGVLETDFTEDMADAIKKYTDVDCVLVRRHGVFVWGDTWERAKIQAEAYDDLFAVAIKMRQAGFNPEEKP